MINAVIDKYLNESILNNVQKTAIMQVIQPAVPEIIKNSAALEYMHSFRYKLPTTIIAILAMPKMNMIEKKVANAIVACLTMSKLYVIV